MTDLEHPLPRTPCAPAARIEAAIPYGSPPITTRCRSRLLRQRDSDARGSRAAGVRPLPADRAPLELRTRHAADLPAGGRRLRTHLLTAERRGHERHRAARAGPGGRPPEHLVPVRRCTRPRRRHRGHRRQNRSSRHAAGDPERIPRRALRLGRCRRARHPRHDPACAGRPGDRRARTARARQRRGGTRADRRGRLSPGRRWTAMPGPNRSRHEARAPFARTGAFPGLGGAGPGGPAGDPGSRAGERRRARERNDRTRALAALRRRPDRAPPLRLRRPTRGGRPSASPATRSTPSPTRPPPRARSDRRREPAADRAAPGRGHLPRGGIQA